MVVYTSDTFNYFLNVYANNILDFVIMALVNMENLMVDLIGILLFLITLSLIFISGRNLVLIARFTVLLLSNVYGLSVFLLLATLLLNPLLMWLDTL